MDKKRIILTCAVIVPAIIAAFFLSPLILQVLPDYVNETFYINVEKDWAAYSGEYNKEIYPWGYYDADNPTLPSDAEILKNIEDMAAGFLGATSLKDMEFTLELSGDASWGRDERFLFVKDHIFSSGGIDYILSLAYDTETNRFITLHCDSGGEFNREAILSGQSALEQKITAYTSLGEHVGADDTITFYHKQVLQLNGELPHGFDLDDITVKRKGKDIFVVFPKKTVDLLFYWNPISKEFEGFCINTLS